MAMAGTNTRKPAYAVALWGVFGFAVIVLKALWRLTPMALAPMRDGTMSPLHWALFAGWLAFMLYSEGYKGFQRQFAPRVAARAMYAARHPRPLIVLLAPLFCMGLFHATRKRLIVSWCVVAGIATLVTVVRQLDQPWRGIIDAGVVAGLAWGLAATFWFLVRALKGHPMPVPADVPEDDAGVAREPGRG